VLEALKNGADANARDGRGTSALKYAMTFGDVKTANVLIKHGAKVKDQVTVILIV
jgi:ankyrin repeat protein